MHTNIYIEVTNSKHNVPVPYVDVPCVGRIICDFIQTACISLCMWVIIM